MERNKGEAIRAIQLSELKIQENDFSGAWEMARLAHQLIPEDENVCKLLALSEVYYTIFVSGQSCRTRDTGSADIEKLVENVSSPSGTLNDDENGESDDGDDDSDDDYDDDDDDDDDDDEDEDDDFDDHNEYDDHDTDDDGDGNGDLVIAPKRLREKQSKSSAEKKEKNSVEGVVSKSAVTRPKRLRHSQFLSVINRMQDTHKDHVTISSMKSSSTLASSAAQLCDFNAQKSADKIQVGQIWALYSNGNGMPKTFAQVKQINVRPNRRLKRTAISGEFFLRMGLLEPFSEPRNMGEPVCCGKFKVKRAPPTLFSVTSLSHHIEPKLLGHNIFEIRPKRGEVWALHKEHNPTVTCSKMRKGDWLVVEVIYVMNEKTMTVILEQLNGFNFVYKAPTEQSRKTGTLDIPNDELGRFSHQISAFKHNKTGNSRLAGFWEPGCWELDPLSVSGYEKDSVPKLLFDSDHAFPLNTPQNSHLRVDMKMNQTSVNSETHGLSSESLEVKAEPEMGSASMQTGNIRETPFAESETSEKVELQVGHFTFFSKDIAGSVKLEASQCVNAVDNGIHITKDGNLIQPKGNAIPLVG